MVVGIQLYGCILPPYPVGRYERSRALTKPHKTRSNVHSSAISHKRVQSSPSPHALRHTDATGQRAPPACTRSPPPPPPGISSTARTATTATTPSTTAAPQQMRPAICDEVGQQPRMAALQKESGVQGGSARADQVGAPSTHQAARGALRMVRLGPEVNHPTGGWLVVVG